MLNHSVRPLDSWIWNVWTYYEQPLLNSPFYPNFGLFFIKIANNLMLLRILGNFHHHLNHFTFIMLSDKDSLRPDTEWAFQTYVVQSNFELLKLCSDVFNGYSSWFVQKHAQYNICMDVLCKNLVITNDQLKPVGQHPNPDQLDVLDYHYHFFWYHVNILFSTHLCSHMTSVWLLGWFSDCQGNSSAEARCFCVIIGPQLPT